MATTPEDISGNIITNPLTGITMTGVKAHAVAETDDAPLCTICQEDIESDTPALLHSKASQGCGGLFHATCLYQSVVEDRQCPNCRGQIQNSMTLTEIWDKFEKYYQHRRAAATERFGNDNDDSEEFLAVPGYRAQAVHYRRCLETFEERTKRLNEAYVCRNKEETYTVQTLAQKVANLKYHHGDLVEAVRCRARQRLMAGVLPSNEKMEEYIAQSCRDSREEFQEALKEAANKVSEGHKVALDTFMGRQSDIERRYSDNIAFFVWELEKRRAADPRSGEWMDDPIIPCVRHNN